MMPRWGIAPLLLCLSACATSAAGRRPAGMAELALGSSAVPVSELDKVWERARTTGGVLVIEPETHVSGTQAATKKTWEAADRFLKVFWGDEPIWFPSDLVRRTVCSDDARWSYFWHLASGDERDLHPWFPRGLDSLVGAPLAKAISGSGSVDVSSCADVGGGDTACLYGEVTAPLSFDRWFCGGIKGDCKERLRVRPRDVNRDLAGSLCVSGPWVHERVHGGRPEIHPADVMWSRLAPRDEWRVALVPDHSGRFEKDEVFRSLVQGDRATSGWSKRRPLELWIAFEADAGAAAEFDAASRCIKDAGDKTVPAQAIKLPQAGGDFAAVSPPMEGMTMSARTWRKDTTTRGLLVLHTDSRVSGCDAVVLALARRAAGDPAATLALAPTGPPAPPPPQAPVEAQPPALRVRTVDKVSRRRPSIRGLEEFGVETLAGFAGGTPTEEDDQGVADRLNAALRGNAKQRADIFGTERPFTIQWEVEARRIADGAFVPVRVGKHPQPGDQHVTVRHFRSELTREVKVNPSEAAPAPGAAKKGVVRVGDLLVTVPYGVRVRGRGVVQFIGSKPPVRSSTAGIGFSSPATGDEWELLGEILQWIPGDAPQRLSKLQALACHPLPGPCPLATIAKHARDGIRDPGTRFAVLRDLEDPQRTFARFVRHLAVGYLFNGSADSTEVQSLKDLLEAACLKPPGGTPPASFCE
jgi:hypothetical protein